MSRTFKHDLLIEIKERWSPRAFSTEKIAREEIEALLEAASYAPSCFNEQPWRFLVADEENTLKKLRSALTPSNQNWANSAPVLLLIVSKKTFSSGGKDNYWHMFDAGTAWGFLSLEAQKRGLCTHAMGGFNRTIVKELFKLPDDLTVITVVAVGRYGDKNSLPAELLERETPGTRKPVSELILNTDF